MGSLKLTLSEVLENSCFSGATVIAGTAGLDRIVRWVHVMEVTEIGKLLSGNELILSTGIGWGMEKKERSLSYLEQLINAGASGLCVELVKFANEIPIEMIELANKRDFPIIIFRKEVRFIDITQIINMKLMENQYKILAVLEDFSRKLNEILSSPNALKKMLVLLHSELNVNVLYLSRNIEQVYFVPVQDEVKQKNLLKIVEEDRKKRRLNPKKQYVCANGSYACQSIQTLGHTYADLIIYGSEQYIGDFELLMLDRCANAISQDLVRILYMEEQKKHEEKQLIHEWIMGERHEEEIKQYLSSIDPYLKPKGAIVIACNHEEKLSDSNYYSYYLPFFRSIFQNHSLYLFSEFDNSHLIFVLINLREDDWKKRVSKALKQIRQTDLFINHSTDQPIFGVGKYLRSIHNLSDSYLTAKESLQIQRKVNMPHEYFYENLHIYRLVSMLNKHEDLLEYIYEYIGPVIEHDERNNSELLNTLAVLLESNGSKKDAANRLYIVRQTLYHRLDKLKELLGEDYMEPTKRAAIEFSLYAYRYLTLTKQTTTSVIRAVR